jgi:hypothetical protein
LSRTKGYTFEFNSAISLKFVNLIGSGGDIVVVKDCKPGNGSMSKSKMKLPNYCPNIIDPVHIQSR